MNKGKVDQYLKYAYEALNNSKIVKNNTIDEGYKGQIATFGAAIASGSLLSATAFFSQKGGSKFERPELLEVILQTILKYHKIEKRNEDDNLFKLVKDYQNNNSDIVILKNDVLEAATAVKLAMNLFEFKVKEDVND